MFVVKNILMIYEILRQEGLKLALLVRQSANLSLHHSSNFFCFLMRTHENRLVEK